MPTTAYVDFTYYTNSYHGTLVGSEDFGRLALAASFEVNRLTYQRSDPVIAANVEADLVSCIKLATCSAVDTLYLSEGQDDGIKSESTGNNSVTYNDQSSKQLTLDGKLDTAVRRYLSGTDLLYRGVDC